MRHHPEKIELLQKEITDINFTIAKERERLNIIESDITIEVNTAKGIDGKPLFSNDSLRKAAITKQCDDEYEYTRIKNGLEESEKNRLYKMAELERLRLEFKLFLLDRQEEISDKTV